MFLDVPPLGKLYINSTKLSFLLLISRRALLSVAD